MTYNSASSGRDGEAHAAQVLREAGYRIIARNVRLAGGEIDLICRDGETIVFVEVKRRVSRRFGSAVAGVDARKRATLRRLAADYLQIVAPDARARFDVVALDGRRVTVHRNAF